MLKANALDVFYEIMNILGYRGLVTNMKLDRGTLPDGVYAYELRDDGNGSICEIRNDIPDESFWGMVVLAEQICGASAGVRLDDNDYCFTGERGKLSVISERPEVTQWRIM